MTRVLVLNAGSSSLKFRLYDAADGEPGLILRGEYEPISGPVRFEAVDAAGTPLAGEEPAGLAGDRDAVLAHLLAWLEARLGGARPDAVGHRVVHGGSSHAEPVLASPVVIDALESLVPLAPLHQPHNLAPVRRLAQVAPELPQVLCFDTAFHRSQPWVEQTYALPRALSAAGVRRYGFHGLSYEYVAGRLRSLSPALAEGRVVVAHLGNGASMCAMKSGRSVASTMGFTALEGLPMGTRAGSVDAGVLLHLMNEFGYDAARLERLLYRESGLLGVSGISGDMRTLEASPAAEAGEAIELFVHRIGRELGALVAVLGGLDGLVFTAGIGENSARVRGAVMRHAAWLGVVPDVAANARHADVISAAPSRVEVRVVATDEELMIARHTIALLAASDLGAGERRIVH